MADSSKPEQPSVMRGDGGLIVGKAVLGAIPVVGGSLAALLEFVPTARERNTAKAIGFLREKIATLENRIDTESIDKDEFAERYASLRRSRRARTETKNCVPLRIFLVRFSCGKAIRRKYPMINSTT
jgi:hypothetical protein